MARKPDEHNIENTCQTSESGEVLGSDEDLDSNKNAAREPVEKHGLPKH